MFMLAFDVVVKTTLAERWMVSRLSKHLILRVVKDGEVDAIVSGYSVEDVAIPFFVCNCNELRGRLLAGITAVMDKFNIVAVLDDF
jgi:hypothetical protein